jgi:DNA-directed RNA polymerase omega subunit
MAEENEELNEETSEDTIVTKEIPAIDSKYRMIILAAQRSKQLQRGAIPRIDVDMRKNKPTRVAMKEIKNNKINFDILES